MCDEVACRGQQQLQGATDGSRSAGFLHVQHRITRHLSSLINHTMKTKQKKSPSWHNTSAPSNSDVSVRYTCSKTITPHVHGVGKRRRA
ncbi:hypothetical protein PoB_005190100 [Plakobranchus ocellatus]|uniref:Uncharacterized protein n=1 Tax=Plakobranchus ocellatus TaxID=259542 RepID=A0AAV4C1Z5_9GAST|nr:hypothetical protein PoB_005190100 [Plakobranchus ocellatus]